MEEQKLSILKDMLGPYDKKGSEFLFKCPKPKCSSDKNKLSINFKNGFKCWVCLFAGKNLTFLVKRFGSAKQIAAWKHKLKIYDLNKFDNLFKNSKRKQEIKLKLPEDFQPITNNKTWHAQKTREYLLGRGLSDDDILWWKIGFCTDTREYKGRAIIPSFDSDGFLNYFVGRSLYEDSYIKYRNANCSKNIIFNDLFIDWDKEIILVEGVFDAVKAGSNSIPILGSSLVENSKLFEKILENRSKVFIGLDQDAQKKQRKIINLMIDYEIEVRSIPNLKGFDFGDLRKEQFQQQKTKSKTINNCNKFIFNIEAKLNECRI